MNPAARLDELAELENRRHLLADQLAELESERGSLIRTLIEDGARISDLVAITGLSRARIYQIRDRRR